MNKIIEVTKVNYSVNHKNLLGKNEEKTILKDISFSINHKEIIGITGESGSGKTTLSKLLAGIMEPVSGEIKYFFQDNRHKIKTQAVQILFQNNNEILNPSRIVSDIVEEVILIRNKGQIGKEAEKGHIFKSVGLQSSLWNRKGFELSGGEQQRAALARILAAKPELLILDEPFSAQDVESQLNLLNLFKRINDEFNLTLICVAHNLKILRKLADRIFIMYKGEIVESGSTEKIFNSPEKDYTKFLLKCENYNLKYEDLRFSQSL